MCFSVGFDPDSACLITPSGLSTALGGVASSPSPSLMPCAPRKDGAPHCLFASNLSAQQAHTDARAASCFLSSESFIPVLSKVDLVLLLY